MIPLTIFNIPLPDWSLIVLIVLFSLLLGGLLEKALLPQLLRLAEKTPLKLHRVLLQALEGLLLCGSLLIGAELALQVLNQTHSIGGWVHQALLIILLISLTLFASRLTQGSIVFFVNRFGSARQSTSILVNIGRAIVLLIGGLVILQTLGISILPIVTALGVGGLAVSLALQEPLANLFAGLFLLLSHDFHPGQYIHLASGESGIIEDISWRNTSLRSDTGQRILIPNNKLVTAIVTRHQHPYPSETIQVILPLYPQSDLVLAEQVCSQTIVQILPHYLSEADLSNFPPTILIRYKDISPAGTVQLQVTLILAKGFVSALDAIKEVLKHDLIKHLIQDLQQSGITLVQPLSDRLADGKIPPASDRRLEG